MRVDLSDSLILHRRPWRETSLIVDAFDRRIGRIALVARGARRPKGRWRGLLEPLARLELSYTGRGDMYTLTDAQPTLFRSLTGNRLLAGLYASELLLRLTARDDPHPLLFDSIAGLLDVLAAEAPAVVALRFFERDLLADLGYALDLDTVADTGRPIDADTRYWYAPTQGALASRPDASTEGVAINGSALLGLAVGVFDNPTDVRDARALMRAAITPLLDNRPLRSVGTMAAMQRLSRPSAGLASTSHDPNDF